MRPRWWSSRPSLSRVPCFLGVGLLILSAGDAVGQAPAQPKSSVDRAIDQLAATRRFKEVAIAPDGKRVAWVQALPETRNAPSPGTAIYVADVRTPATPPRRHPALGCG